MKEIVNLILKRNMKHTRHHINYYKLKEVNIKL